MQTPLGTPLSEADAEDAKAVLCYHPHAADKLEGTCACVRVCLFLFAMALFLCLLTVAVLIGRCIVAVGFSFVGACQPLPGFTMSAHADVVMIVLVVALMLLLLLLLMLA